MTSQEMNSLFQRELSQLATKVSTYEEEDLWVISKSIPNCAGNLCLHICGNLQHFIGHILGGTDYVRNRDAEFAEKGVPKADLIAEIHRTMDVLDKSFSAMSEGDFNQVYPIRYREEELTVRKWLIHLFGHLSYHLGQLDYHRRGIIG